MSEAYRKDRTPRYRRLTAERYAEIKRRADAGESLASIAIDMGVNAATVWRVKHALSKPRQSFRKRFFSYVDVTGPTMPTMTTPCHIWTGARIAGYGVVYVDENTPLTHASRAAFFLKHGRWPACALHHCDNGAGGCVNADHLFDGSRADNVRDMIAKGRQRWAEPPHPTGERSPRSTISDATRAEIRRRRVDGQFYREIAEALGLKLSQVFYVCKKGRDSHG